MEKLGSTLIRSGRTVVNADREPAIFACSSSGTPARISARIFRDWGNVDSLWG